MRRERQAHDPSYPNLWHLVISLYSFAVLTVSRVALVPLFHRLGDRLIPKDVSKREMRVQRFAGQLWKTLYHTSVTVFPMWAFRGQSFWPPGFAGAEALFEKYPYTPQVPYLREFYMVQFGYYLHAFVATLMQRGRPNIVEMTVHHLATLALIFVSYFVQNTPRFGVSVMWVHDVCDVPVSFTRVVVDLSWTLPTAVSYVLLMASWLVFRLYVFPFRLIYASSYECFHKGVVRFSDAYSWIPLTGLLIVLVFMHVQWFIELAGMGKVYLKTGARVDSTEATEEDVKEAAAAAASKKKKQSEDKKNKTATKKKAQ